MGRTPVPGPQGRHQGSGQGLEVKPRGHRLHIVGTVTVRGESVRVRQSTGLDRRTPGAWERANEIRRQVEADIQDQIIHGVAPACRFATAAGRYIEAETPGGTDLANLDELVLAFGETLLTTLQSTPALIDDWYRARFKGRSPATIRRHQNTLRTVLQFAVDQMDALPAVPKFQRARVRHRKGAAVMKRFHPGEVEMMVDCAPLHGRPILATLYSTGSRVAQTLYLSREHFILAPGRGRVIFPETKNRNSYSRPLHDYAVGILTDWFAGRTDRHAAAFLTPKGQPYKPAGARGGQIKAMFDGARDKAVARLIAAGRRDRARVVAQATPHWFRHNLANVLRQDMGADVKTIMEAGCWESESVVIQNYLADAPDHTEAAVRALPFGTPPLLDDAGTG